MSNKQIYWGLVPMSHYQHKIVIKPHVVNHYEDYVVIEGSDKFKQAKKFESLQGIAGQLNNNL